MEQIALLFVANQAKQINQAFEVVLDERSKQIAENAARIALEMTRKNR